MIAAGHELATVAQLHWVVIRRRVELLPNQAQFWLIRQDHHANLAGELAAAFGNDLYMPPADREQVVLATSMHDAGWPLHDDAPELSELGLPSDVFETPIERGVRVWEEGAARAEAVDPYAGLLVSIHVQRLAGFADREPGKLSNRERFWLIRFRNNQAQRQMRLRKQLGLRTDRPLDYGLSLAEDREAAADSAEQRLAFDVRLLQAMDMLSLCICCTEPPTASIGPLLRRPGGSSLPLRVTAPEPFRLTLRPWPFGVGQLSLGVPYRAVPARAFDSARELGAVLAEARPERFEVTLTRG